MYVCKEPETVNEEIYNLKLATNFSNFQFTINGFRLTVSVRFRFDLRLFCSTSTTQQQKKKKK